MIDITKDNALLILIKIITKVQRLTAMNPHIDKISITIDIADDQDMLGNMFITKDHITLTEIEEDSRLITIFDQIAENYLVWRIRKWKES